MAKFTVTAPQPVTAKVCGVAFADGKATVDSETHRAALGYFRRRGYTVEEISAAPAASVEETPERPDAPSRAGSTEAWRTWAIEHGGMTDEEAAALSRDELAEKYLGPKEG